MMNIFSNRKRLRGGTALQALALIGAGVGTVAGFAAPAAAQDYTNVTATGRVVGADGSPIAGATVSVTSDDQGFTRTATTGNSGSYRIPALPAGNYTFTVSANGFETFNEAGVRLDQSGSANQFTLVTVEAASASDIVVRGTRTEVADFDQTTTGAVIDVAELASRVPVARDLTSVIKLAPGTNGGDSAFGNLASAVGSSVSENVFYINGLNITDFRQGLGSVTVPFDFYQTIDIKNGGYPAEYGRATGAFVNATTKSGSNEFHGSIKFNWEPDSLRSKKPNNYYRDDDFRQSDRREMIAQLSGPIIKDHLFFYGLYNAREVNSQFATTSPTFDPSTGDLTGINGVSAYYNRTQSPFWGGKLDAVIVDGQRLEFTYFDTSGTTQRTIFGDPATTPYNPETNAPGPYNGTQIFEYGGKNYVGRYTGQFTDWLTISAAYGKNHSRDNQVSTRDDYPYINDSRGGTSNPIGNPVNAIQFQQDTREFYRGDVDLYFNLFGNHHVKFGFDHENLTSDNQTNYTGGLAYTYIRAQAGDTFGVTPGTDYVKVRTFVNGGIFKSTNEAYYIEDSWSLFNDRLSLKIGARDDKFTNKNIAGETYYDSGDNWQPRLGFTFDPTGDGRSKVYGSFSRYYLPIATNTNIRLGGAELDYDQLYYLTGLNADNTPILGGPIANQSCERVGVSGNNCVLRNDGKPSPLDTVVAQNLENQSVDEYILGVEQRVGRYWKFGLYGTYRNLNASLEDAAIDQGILTYCADNGITDCGGGDFFGANQYTLINPGKSVTVTPAAPLDGSLDPITLTPDQLGYPTAKRKYEAVTFTFEREFDGVWSIQGSYTYSKNLGNIEGGVKSDNGQTDSGLSTDFDFPSLMLGSYGYLPNDRRHNLKIFGSYSPNDWLTVGGNFIAVSPRRFGCLGQVPDYISSPALIRSGQSYDYGYAYGDAGHSCVVDDAGKIVTNPSNPGGYSRQIIQRGSVFKSDWLTQLDLTFAFRLPVSTFDSTLRFDVFNVFNQHNKLEFTEQGTDDSGAPRADYRAVSANGYQNPRYVRIQFQVGF